MKLFRSWKFTIVIAVLSLVNVFIAISIGDSALGWVSASLGWLTASMYQYGVENSG